MALTFLDREGSVVIAIDLQTGFLKAIWEADRVVSRSSFLIQTAARLGIPIIGTTQNLERMGGLDDSLSKHLPGAIDKMSFSCCGSDEFDRALSSTGRRKVVIVGIETHICVSLTAQDLIRRGYEVVVCPDAVSARTQDRHRLGMERIRDAGAVPAHSEGVAYEWLGSASDPAFRDVLTLVKGS